MFILVRVNLWTHYLSILYARDDDLFIGFKCLSDSVMHNAHINTQ
jgi:hypothetical protein